MTGYYVTMGGDAPFGLQMVMTHCETEEAAWEYVDAVDPDRISQVWYLDTAGDATRMLEGATS